MRRLPCQVQEERPIFACSGVLVDDPLRLFGIHKGRKCTVLSRGRCLVSPKIDKHNVFVGRVLVDVILAAFEKPKVLIKPAVDGKVFGRARANMPLADNCRVIRGVRRADRFEPLREQSHTQVGSSRVGDEVVAIVLRDVNWQTSRQERRARRAAVSVSYTHLTLPTKA